MNVSGEKPILLTVCWGPDQYALMLLHSDLWLCHLNIISENHNYWCQLKGIKGIGCSNSVYEMSSPEFDL